MIVNLLIIVEMVYSRNKNNVMMVTPTSMMVAFSVDGSANKNVSPVREVFAHNARNISVGF